MHLLLGLLVFLFISLSYSASANSATTNGSSTCFTIAQGPKPSGHGASETNRTVDTVIVLGSSLYVIPTIGMSLVFGSGAVALHHLGKSIYDETIIEDRKKIALLIAEAMHFTETNGNNLASQNSFGSDQEEAIRPNSTWRHERTLNSTTKRRYSEQGSSAVEYVELKSLLRRLNFPFSSKYKIEQIAPLIVAANNDPTFCSNPRILRPVHFKDYVLTHWNQ